VSEKRPEDFRFFREHLKSQAQVDGRILAVTSEIAAHYRKQNVGRIALVGIAEGGLIFTNKLHSLLSEVASWLEVEKHFFTMTATQEDGSLGDPRITVPLDPSVDLGGMHVLNSEDMQDRGATLTTAKAYLDSYEPASLESAVMLQRQIARPKGTAMPKFVAIQYRGSGWVYGNGPNDKRLGKDFYNEGRDYPGIVANYPQHQMPEAA